MTTRDLKHLDLANPIASTLLVAWHWAESTIPLMQSTYGKLLKLAAAEPRFLDQYYGNNANPNLTPAGKQSANETAFSGTLAPAYRDAYVEGQSMKNMIATLKVNSLPRPDPTDVGAALARSDIRRIFLGMDEIRKQVAIKANPSAQLSAALLEFPPELIGLTGQDVQELTAAFGESSFPEKAAQIRELTSGLEALTTMLAVAEVLAGDKLRMNAQQQQTLIWGGPLPENKRM